MVFWCPAFSDASARYVKVFHHLYLPLIIVALIHDGTLAAHLAASSLQLTSRQACAAPVRQTVRRIASLSVFG
jgi:hypothetical protein